MQSLLCFSLFSSDSSRFYQSFLLWIIIRTDFDFDIDFISFLNKFFISKLFKIFGLLDSFLFCSFLFCSFFYPFARIEQYGFFLQICYWDQFVSKMYACAYDSTEFKLQILEMFIFCEHLSQLGEWKKCRIDFKMAIKAISE